MQRLLVPTALCTVFVAALAPATSVAAAAPLYLVVDHVPAKAAAPKAGDRRLAMVVTFANGDAAACARAQRRTPASPAQGTASSCVSTVPAELAPVLTDAGLAKAYVLKFSIAGQPDVSYRAMFDMSTKDPQQVCHNLVDYQQRFGGMDPSTRIQCWVPRG